MYMHYMTHADVQNTALFSLLIYIMEIQEFLSDCF